jgi:hypothetical protein
MGSRMVSKESKLIELLTFHGGSFIFMSPSTRLFFYAQFVYGNIQFLRAYLALIPDRSLPPPQGNRDLLAVPH